MTPDETLTPDPRRPRRRLRLRGVLLLPYWCACWLLAEAVRFIFWLATDH